MKFLILIDRIYSKIMIFFLLLSIPFTAFSIYLYLNLPNIIPVQFGLRFEPSNWGNKATIFMFPLIFLILPTFMSRKSISSQEKLLTRSASAEIIIIVILTFLLIMMIGVYYLYFRML